MAKYKVTLNDESNLRELLQETYRMAEEQVVQAEREINRLANATQLQNETMDAKSKYAKSINDYLAVKDRAINKKLEIARILKDVITYNTNAKKEEGFNEDKAFDFSKIKQMVDESYNNNPNKDE